MPNLFRSGSDTTITGSIFKGPFTIGVTTASIKGPTVANNGFYNGITPLTGSTTQNQQYAIYAVKSTQGPSIRIGVYGVGGFNQTNDLQSIAVQYGATGSVTGSSNLPNLIKWFSDNGYVVTNFDYGNIVTNGLALIYDAAYPPSYPFTGSVVYDLSGKGADGTLNGNVFMVTDPSGLTDDTSRCFFDFGTQRAYITSSIISSTVSQSYMDFTMILQPYFGLTTPSTLVGLFAATTPAGNSDKSMRMVITGSGSTAAWTMTGRNPGDQNDWCYPSASTFYINGVSGSTMTSGSQYYCFGGARTNTTQGAFSGSFPVFIGSSGWSGDNRSFQGRIGVVLMYNRVLSAAEQLQNYNALKNRFRM
jgi:hypothetical protein